MDSSETIIKSDFMMKRSQLKHWYSKDNFKSRWFILSNVSLKYVDGTPNSGFQNIKSTIQLTSIRVVENVDDEALNMANTFQVVHLEEGQYHLLYIIASYFEQRETWISKLREACIAAGATLFKQYHPGAWISKTGQFTCCNQLVRGSQGCQLNEYRTPSKTSDDIASQNDEDFEMPSQELLVVLHGFEETSMFRNAISVIQGEEVQLIEETDEDWWFIEKLDCKIRGYAPSKYFKKISTNRLETFGWYLPSLTIKGAAALLSDDGSIGCFLIRHSSTNSLYRLSVLTKKKNSNEKYVKHFKIHGDSGLWHVADSKNEFASLPELISYYKEKKEGGIGTQLKHKPPLTIKGAEALLSDDGSIGCFLIRHASTFSIYTLSVLTEQKNSNVNCVKHFKIYKNSGLWHFSDSQNEFTSLPELVSHYRANKGGIGTQLRHPPNECIPAPSYLKRDMPLLIQL